VNEASSIEDSLGRWRFAVDGQVGQQHAPGVRKSALDQMESRQGDDYVPEAAQTVNQHSSDAVEIHRRSIWS
jgi:hypothetical protein